MTANPHRPASPPARKNAPPAQPTEWAGGAYAVRPAKRAVGRIYWPVSSNHSAVAVAGSLPPASLAAAVSFA